DDESLVVVSSDLSHYHPYDIAVSLDRVSIKAISNLDSERVSTCEVCGMEGILVLMEMAKAKGWTGKILDYKNSGDTGGGKEGVVGYSSIVFH
ncbi:MAG: AmmeMemoRadiSam system protein B, partial [Oligoflexales bacterium]|nr:AmmeMemoRadiSam system protein B [Oligoflexales bacterium]